MTLLSQIESDFVAAYKAKDQVKVGVLRMLKTAAKNKQVELMRPLDDGDAMDMLAKQAKQRQESIDQFRAAGRDDLADKEAAELVVILAYLPQPLSSQELEAAVDAAIAEQGAKGMQDMGKVMQAIMAAHKGRVDGKALSALVRARLSA
ncbi:MAG: GatB/YqeY domain-containing protein [Desulfovibrionaceae bacterium]